jgi:hypothetical protein
LKLDHELAPETFDLHLESIISCENSVMKIIFEISLLNNWKKEAENTNKLSVVELAKRGGQIEQRLSQRLADSECTPSTRLALYAEANRIFLLAAFTYLHVVISGPYPELPEIAEKHLENYRCFPKVTRRKNVSKYGLAILYLGMPGT